MRVVVIVLDALPPRHVTPETTPALHRYATDGGWRPQGGSAVLATSTYPNHATFATGAGPAAHGVFANEVMTTDGPVAARSVGPAVSTIFTACGERGISTTAVVGDQHLVGVMGLGDADEAWPPGGSLPPGTAIDPLGYARDLAVLEEAVPALEEGRPGLVFVHLNEPDTFAHGFGPDDPAALEGYRGTDRALATLMDAAGSAWRDTVVLIVSDHEQETVTATAPIDLSGWARDLGPGWAVLDEGSAAVLCGPPSEEPPWVPGIVEGTRRLDAGHLLLWGPEGSWFGPEDAPQRPRGVHGSPRTRGQVMVATGGSPIVRHLAAALLRPHVGAEDLAPTVARLLDVPLPAATGTGLL